MTKTLSTGIGLAFVICVTASGQTTNRTPINRGLLQSNMDANGKSITNAGDFVTDWNHQFIGNGAGLTNVSGGGGGSSPGRNMEASGATLSTVTNPVFTTMMVSNPASGGSSTTFILSGNTATGGKADTFTTDPSALGLTLGGSGRLFRVPSTVTTGIFYGDASGTSNAVPPFAYSTNESHVLQFIGTNSLYASGAGTATANGVYNLKGTSGGISVWTNVNGNAGLALDPSFHVFLDEQSITNGAGTLLYDAIGTVPFPATVWGVESGTGPAPTVVVGTNTFSTNITAYYPLGGSFGKVLNTNYYFVNPINGNDTNAVPGSRERPYQNFTNVVWNYAVHTNDVVLLEKGTNYFGFTTMQISNGVSIVGLGPDRDSYYFAKDASMVDVSDVGIKPGIGSTFANFSGNITIGSFNSANVYLNNLHTVGMIDNFLPQGCSNLVTENCFFECNATSGNPLIDAGVINSISSVTKNCIFSVRRRGNGASTGRALVVKGGTNLIVGCTFISLDTTNSANNFGCIGLSIEGNGYTTVAGCVALAANTNANNFCGFTNAFGSGGETVGSGPISLAYTNGAVTWVSPQSAKITGNVAAASFSGDGSLLTSLNAAALATGLVPTARLGVGTASSLTFLRGDGTWAGSSGSQTPWISEVDGARFGLTNFGWQYSSNTLRASGAIYYQTNSDLFPLLAITTNSPLKTGSANALANGALGGSNLFLVESPGHVGDFAVRTNGNVKIGNPSTATTVVNLGLDANGTVTTNAQPVGSVSGAWNTVGNSSLAANSFLGTTDWYPLELRTANRRVAFFDMQDAPDFLTGGSSAGPNTILTNGTTSANAIVGGFDNIITNSASAVIIGGQANRIGNGNTYGGIFGSTSSLLSPSGSWCSIFSSDTSAAGGVSVLKATIIGGLNNTNTGSYSIVLGGRQLLADHNYGLAAGRRAKSQHDGTFVWGDQTDADFVDAGQDTFNVRAKSHFLSNSASASSWMSFSNGAIMGPVSINTSNFAAIRNATFYQTNSGNFSLFYIGTNPPTAGHENSINNGVIRSNSVFKVEVPGVADALDVETNGQVIASVGITTPTLTATNATGSNYFGANVNVNGTINFLGGTNTGSFTSIGSNYLSAAVVGSMATPTNSMGTSFDFTKLIGLLTTNNAFVTTGVSGKDSSGKMMQWSTIAVTNSAGLGSAFVTNITFAANTHVIGPTTLNLTNWTELMCEYWPPNGPTNVFVTPCW